MGRAGMVDVREAEPAVRVRGLRKTYQRNIAVEDVDLEVHEGEIYGLVGPDGAGKSSLMKAVAGVLAFDSGLVEVFGTGIHSERSAERVKPRIGFMPQGLGLNLYPELTVEENVDFFARLRLVPAPELERRKRRLLSMTRLEPFTARPMKALSGGMKQKLGLVCTLIHEPDLVILDEPTTGVDPVSRRDFWAILADILGQRGMSALVSTAYMDEASRFHRVSLMHEGRGLVRGRIEEILGLVPGRVVEIEARPQAEAVSLLRSSFAHVEARGRLIRVFAEGEDEAGALFKVRRTLGGMSQEKARAVAPELEDVLMALLRRQGLEEEQRGAAPSSRAASGPCTTADPAIAARDLVKDFGPFRAVDRVSFRVPQGEIFGLLGANGAGKTTVIKMLTGILSPTSGEGLVAGADMRGAARRIKERIGYMSQSFSLYHDLTVSENIRLYAGIYGLSRRLTRERSAWILQMAGLEGRGREQAGGLSMGLRQRLALGCALVHRPGILFLDEPTSGVDPGGRRRFWEILFRLSREEGVAVLVTTHYMSEAEHCDHLALMYAGRIVADASPEVMKRGVWEEAGVMLEVEAERPLRAMGLLEGAGFEGVALFGNRIHLLHRNPAGARDKIRATLARGGISVKGIREQPLTMEDVFIHKVLSLERGEQRAGGAK